MMIKNRVDEIEGAELISTHSFSDNRGTFTKFQDIHKFHINLNSLAFSTNERAGTIRGLHFQVEPFAEEKIVTCIQGSVFDVLVDLRANSTTFGKWASYELDSRKSVQLYIPKGVAHGFQTLVPNSIIQYCLSSVYSPDSSYVINPLGDLDIFWPIQEITISERDSSGISLALAAVKYAETQ
jgi:dTDP-4-dehydrorhamnose 3,5-epimerase